MATFLMFGKYSPDALKEISAERTDKAVALIKEHGGSITRLTEARSLLRSIVLQ